MDQELWQKTNEILLAALELPVEKRRSFLDWACEDDRVLLNEVESLLAADPGALLRVDRPAFQWFRPEPGPVGEGHRVGPYEILRELGRGGLAVVYLGERKDAEDPRRVAVKVLKRGMDTDAIVRRFHGEGEILASLKHPNIAELYGGGTTEDHRPYLAVEYVDGEPIDELCGRRGTSIRDRIRVIRKVCSAVQYAHQNLIVHRDLKPANILVTDRGEPKLLDFGISKLLHPETSLPETLTAPGQRFMTPSYASPEQVRSEPVSVASDVYSLGVVLYELLTGRLPYRFESRSEAEVQRVICEEDPATPSSVVVPAGRTDAGAKKLSRLLRGDLDSIVLRALRKEPRQRYASVEQLSLDLDRYLAGRPVRAREGTLGYRVGKFLLRSKKTVAAACMLGTVAAAYLVDREARQQEIARERDKAEALKEFLVELFEESDPSEARGNRVTVREVLDRSRHRIDQLRDQPEIQAAIMNTMGRVYRNLGLYAEAKPLLEVALEHRRRIHGNHHLEVAESLAEIGALHWSLGDYDDAHDLLREALAERRRELGVRHRLVAESIDNLAVVLRDRGQLEAAESRYREALAMRRQLFGEDHADVALSLSNLATVLTDLSEYEEAERLYQKALDIRRRLYSGDHPEVASSLSNLSSLLWTRGDPEAAESLQLEALAMRRRLYEGDHPELATSVNNLATLYHTTGRYGEAEPLYRESLAISRRLVGDRHPDVASSLSNLAVLFLDQGNLEEAEPLLRESLDLWRDLVGPEHFAVGVNLHNLGVLLLRKGDSEAAEPIFREALESYRRLFGEDHPRFAATALSLARSLLSRDDAAGAEALARKAVEVYRRKLGGGHWRTAFAETVLGGALTDLARYEEAESLLEAAYPVVEQRKGESAPETQASLRFLIRLLEKTGRPAEASRWHGPEDPS